jgi:hypothetical protein
MSTGLVEMMGGVIGVESNIGSGSEFWFDLNPAVAPQFAVDRAEPAANAPARVRRSRPLRTLLYVEDNPDNLTPVQQLIKRLPDMRLLSQATQFRTKVW